MSSQATPVIEEAIALAAQAHRGQVDKAGEPYVLHLLRVMLRMRRPEQRIIAVLHDLVEDTPYTCDSLRDMGYPESIVSGIDALTRRPTESYMEFVQRAGANDLARAVKLADLEDNLDLRRIPDPQPRDLERIVRYVAARQYLLSMDKTEHPRHLNDH